LVAGRLAPARIDRALSLAMIMPGLAHSRTAPKHASTRCEPRRRRAEPGHP